MRQMLTIEAVLTQVRHVLGLVDELDRSEFPYDHSHQALGLLRQLFLDHERGLAEALETVWLSDEIRDLRVPLAAQDISLLFPFLGFILRSTNVRNAFEAWGPLWRLSRSVLGDETRLLLSSEWEFSPYTFVGCSELPGFVLIGFPASESDGPFLLPLAGHELGHNVWSVRGLKDRVLPKLNNGIIEAIVQDWDSYKGLFAGYGPDDIREGRLAWQFWQDAAEWAKRQACEMFCDFFGLRIFGESFLHAYGYLLAPQREGFRPCEYPNSCERASALASAAETYGVSVPDGFADVFADLDDPTDDDLRIQLLLKAADHGRRNVQSVLVNLADEEASQAGLLLPSEAEVAACVDAFRIMTPAQGSSGLSAVLNAGWRALLTKDFFPGSWPEDKRTELLSDLVLKSLEILEIEQRLRE